MGLCYTRVFFFKSFDWLVVHIVRQSHLLVDLIDNKQTNKQSCVLVTNRKRHGSIRGHLAQAGPYVQAGRQHTQKPLYRYPHSPPLLPQANGMKFKLTKQSLSLSLLSCGSVQSLNKLRLWPRLYVFPKMSCLVTHWKDFKVQMI